MVKLYDYNHSGNIWLYKLGFTMSEYYVDLEQEAEGLGTELSPLNAAQLFAIEKSWGDVFYVRGSYDGENVEVIDGNVNVRLTNWDFDLYGQFSLGPIIAIPLP
jgi:hypothetical protein